MIYPERKEKISSLTKEERSDFLDVLFQYNEWMDNGGDPKTFTSEILQNRVLKITFDFVMPLVSKDYDSYQVVCKRNKENADSRWKAIKEKVPVVSSGNDTVPHDANSNSNSSVSEDTLPPNPQGEKEYGKLKCDTTAEKFLEQRNNVQVFMKCRELTTDIKNIWRDVCKKYTKEQITKGVKGYYDDILARDKNSSYASHRFSLYEFLKQSNGLKRFINK